MTFLSDALFCLGIFTALIACFIDIVIDQLSILKYSFLKNGKRPFNFFFTFANQVYIKLFVVYYIAVDHNVLYGDLYVPYLYYALLSAIPVAFGSILIAYIEVNDTFISLEKSIYIVLILCNIIVACSIR